MDATEDVPEPKKPDDAGLAPLKRTKPLDTNKKAAASSSDHMEISSPKKAAQEIRNEVRNYIRNERDTTLRRWMALNEAMRSEDKRRDQFMEKRLRDDARILPLPIEKLVCNLKRAVHKTMREKGGTPFSILRSMFLYWDGCKVGSLKLDDFKRCLKSLGLEIGEKDLNEIFSYYSKSDGTMGYNELLNDIQKNEPTILEMLPERKDEETALRFTEADDLLPPKTKKLEEFIEACRFQIAEKMRNEGGTTYFHARKIFQRFDYDYSGGLSAEELVIAARSDLRLNMSIEDANEIVRYYDRKKNGEMRHALFISDVCEGLTSILSFSSTTKEALLEHRRKILSNPFIRTPFKAHANKLLTRVIETVRRSLETRVMKVGGSYKSWVHEAFMFWDPRNTGVISDWRQLQGVLKRLGASISQEEAETILTCYDKRNVGSFDFHHLMDDLLYDEPNVITDTTAGLAEQKAMPITARAPPLVNKFVQKLRKSADIFVRKSKGSLESRDIVHGTFLRFDAGLTGRVDAPSFSQACQDLGMNLKASDVEAVITWYDTDGSRMIDYNELTRQLYGDDVQTRAFSLPTLSRSVTSTSALSTTTSSLTFQNGTMTPQVKNDTRAFSNLGGSASLGASTGGGPDKTLVKETRLVKEARKQVRRSLMLQERNRLQNKLESVEKQRKQLIDEHKQKQKNAERK